MAWGIRQAYRDVQAEENAQGWGGCLSLVAAGTAAWFTWASTHNTLCTIIATIAAFFAGYRFGYRFARVCSIVFVMALVTSGVLLYIHYQNARKAEEEAAFDARSLDTTLLWLKNRSRQLAEVDQKRNEILSQEAVAKLNRELAAVEGTAVCWQSPVESVTPTTVRLQGPAASVPVKFALIAAKSYSSNPQSSDPFTLPITSEQSRKLTAGQPVSFTGRVLACRADRSGEQLVFTLHVSEARGAD